MAFKNPKNLRTYLPSSIVFSASNSCGKCLRYARRSDYTLIIRSREVSQTELCLMCLTAFSMAYLSDTLLKCEVKNVRHVRHNIYSRSIIILDVTQACDPLSCKSRCLIPSERMTR